METTVGYNGTDLWIYAAPMTIANYTRFQDYLDIIILTTH